ncbi:transcriptional regulator [Curtobacterium sp. MCBD17_034]|uniref:ArsR/SmtB family transcription factor n=1 Tax=unclassified Curtobacterium TaxID=257496 RepID=UPI000DA8160E|nr:MULTISPECIES: helix-turn-helix domain-containing protein [unclassified Curtobacterium]PZF56042.1 transcriptional regulator [Curtobacterium sp. MCBD17_034]PZM32910.1 transcriptional regulator [Curtobacterium sp. MCBD17_031]
MATNTPEPRVLRVEALKALAHPVRTRLLNELASHGPATATALGARIGESSGSTSYHLRQLAKHGIVEEAPELGSGRDRWWRRYAGPLEFGDHGTDQSRAERTATVLASMSFQDTTAEFIRDALASSDDLPEAWRDVSDFSTAWLLMTPDELAELDRGINDLIGRYLRANDPASRHPDPAARRVFVNYNLFPVLDVPKE